MKALGFSVTLFLIFSFQISGNPLDSSLKASVKPWGTQAGLSVRDAIGKELFNSNADQFFPPASVAKLLSSGCSLKTLGPAFQFETGFGYSGHWNSATGVLTGDLVIRGSGDPSFVIEDLKEVAERLVGVIGLKEIKGKLIFDASYFGKKGIDISDGFEGDTGRAFTATLTSHPFNFNAFSIWVLSDGSESAQVRILPKDVLDLKISNQLKAKAGIFPEVAVQVGSTQISVSGKIPTNFGPKAYYRSVEDPYTYYARSFQRVFKDLGGEWKSPSFIVSEAATPFHSWFSYETRPLSKMLMDINKLSTNFGAELVLLAAAEHQYGRPTNFEKSRKFLEECFATEGIAKNALHLENASGLSRESKLKPSALTQFLSGMRSRDFFPEYLSTLSVLGEDGTMKKRLPELAGRARLKTGSIQGVRALAGYVFSPRSTEGPLSFAVFFHCSDANCPAERVQRTEDQIIQALAEYRP